jgi:hypothetical protein
MLLRKKVFPLVPPRAVVLSWACSHNEMTRRDRESIIHHGDVHAEIIVHLAEKTKAWSDFFVADLFMKKTIHFIGRTPRLGASAAVGSRRSAVVDSLQNNPRGNCSRTGIFPCPGSPCFIYSNSRQAALCKTPLAGASFICFGRCSTPLQPSRPLERRCPAFHLLPFQMHRHLPRRRRSRTARPAFLPDEY